MHARRMALARASQAGQRGMGEDGASPSPQILEVSCAQASARRPVHRRRRDPAAGRLLRPGGAPADSASPSPRPRRPVRGAAPPGATSDAVTVEGAPARSRPPTSRARGHPRRLQRTVVVGGVRRSCRADSCVSYALTAFDADTGEKLGARRHAEGELLPAPLTADSPLGQVIGCADARQPRRRDLPRVGATAPARCYVFDVVEHRPRRGVGRAEQDPDRRHADGQARRRRRPDDRGSRTAMRRRDAGRRPQAGRRRDGREPATRRWCSTRREWSTGEVFDSRWARRHAVRVPDDGRRRRVHEGARGPEGRLAGDRRHAAGRRLRRGRDQRHDLRGRDPRLRRRHPRRRTHRQAQSATAERRGSS